MRTESPALAPYLRSRTQARLLAELLLKPNAARSVTELARLLDTPQSVISQEVNRLVTAQVLADERIGRTRLIRANQNYRLLQPLTQILAATFGPEPVMSRLLGGVQGIHEAFLYGSWAARASGMVGRAPADVDVLVVGTPDRESLTDVMVVAESELGLPVQITRVSQAAWDQAAEPFIRTVKENPMVELKLNQEAA